MSLKTSISSPWFVAVGVSAVVFIGAFAHFDPVPAAIPTSPPVAMVAAKEPLAPETGPTRPPLENSSPSMSEVIRLAESHVDPGVMLAFIQNSGQTYAPTSDDLIYLSRLGVPQNVIAALFPRPQEQPDAIATATPTNAPEVLPQDANSNVFTDALAPYGNWVQVPEYGAAWQPTVETANPDWKPYVDDGQWIDSDSGWYWQSEYPWGATPFHYGGWVNAPQYGWVWIPGTTWAPAWVSWRTANSYVGWAPLPPGVSLNVLSQLAFNGHPVPYGFDFGLAPSAYTFVRASRFLNTNLPRHVLPSGRAASLIASSTVVNNYEVVNHKVVNEGVNRVEIAAAVKHPLPAAPLAPAPALEQLRPGLLASAHGQEIGDSEMRLPPLRANPSPGPSFKHDYTQPFYGEPSDRPVVREFQHPAQPHPDSERREATASPARHVTPAPSATGKSTK
ncbi:MAG TPA: DUF6600 domain-containing protein [Verrucomicrobiae bacterium]|jgi:hypothetical protein|nr:DUF6600 domain-containing protein [Verrucomicrobiae bacterium]